MFSFDNFGWLSLIAIPGRQVSVDPGVSTAPTVGQAYPNWSGTQWVMVIYALPPVPAAPVDPAHGQRNYKAMLQRRADALEKSDPIGALKIRLTSQG